jgi:hypothetical protein
MFSLVSKINQVLSGFLLCLFYSLPPSVHSLFDRLKCLREFDLLHREPGVQTHCQHIVFYWVTGLKQSNINSNKLLLLSLSSDSVELSLSQQIAKFRHNSSTHGSLDLSKDSSITGSLLRISSFVITSSMAKPSSLREFSFLYLSRLPIN